jgi:hypothetical protein
MTAVTLFAANGFVEQIDEVAYVVVSIFSGETTPVIQVDQLQVKRKAKSPDNDIPGMKVTMVLTKGMYVFKACGQCMQ